MGADESTLDYSGEFWNEHACLLARTRKRA